MLYYILIYVIYHYRVHVYIHTYTYVSRADLMDVFRKLKALCHINSILVEGGAEIIQSVLQYNLCHQVIVTLNIAYYGGYRALTGQLPRQVRLGQVRVVTVENNVIIYGTINRDDSGDSDE